MPGHRPAPPRGRGQRSIRQELIGAYRFTRGFATAPDAGEFRNAGAWTVSDLAAELGWRVAEAEGSSRLLVPIDRPAAWFGLVPVATVDGAPYGAGTVMPWPGGEIHHPSGVGGGVVLVSADSRVAIRTRPDLSPCQIRMNALGTALPAGVTVELYAAGV